MTPFLILLASVSVPAAALFWLLWASEKNRRNFEATARSAEHKITIRLKDLIEPGDLRDSP